VESVRNLARRGAFVVLAGAAIACGPNNEVERGTEYGPLRSPFAVSQHFAPSGHMGDGAEAGFVTAHVTNERCKPRLAGARGDCYTFSYVPGELLWAGVYWQHPANNWGSRPGRVLEPGATRVRFMAASNTPDLPVQFIAGGIRDRQKTFADRFRVTSFELLSTDWQEFTLDLSGQSVESVIGAFAWVATFPAGTDRATAEPILVHLDDVVWE
jgi:hypothetical protein